MFSNSQKFIFVLLSLYAVQNTFSFSFDKLKETIQLLLSDQKYQLDFQNMINNLVNQESDYFNYKPTSKFECNVTNLFHEPKTVHELKPSDVKVVAALGDSITAAIGLRSRTILSLLTEFRQYSWSIGGNGDVDSVLTLPNILKKYNPNLYGYSTYSSNPVITILGTGVGFNVAVSGNKATHLLKQAKVLVDRMKKNTRIDYKNDWKVVTLFIGGNDFCQYCYNKDKHSAENFIKNIRDALDLLHKELPRTFVNLVTPINVGDIKDMNDGLVVSALHMAMCSCGAFPKDDDAVNELQALFEKYSNFTEHLANSGRYDTRDDFTVVYQPFFQNFKAPRNENGKVDRTFFAPDAFHFSSKSHAMIARALWNSMITPVGQKATNMQLDDKIACPTEEHPYFYTNKNSNL